MARKPNTLKTTTDLTPKQRLFVDTLVLNWGQKTKQDVAMEVFDCKDRTNASKYAYQLLHPDKSPHVVRYLEMKLAKELKKYETDKLRHYKTYERLQQKAENKNQFNASINAQFRAGQMAGLFIDKREINVSGIEGMSRESLEKRLQELESKINENKKIIDITPEEIIEEQ
jgi:hypothetical protein